MSPMINALTNATIASVLETCQEGVTNPENSVEDLSWMTSLSTDKLQSVERLAQEIRDEAVTDGEKVSFIENFEELMGRTNDIVTCACCGRREVNRTRQMFAQQVKHLTVTTMALRVRLKE